MKRKIFTELVAFRVKASTLQALQDLADREDKDLSELVREMIERGLKTDGERRRRNNDNA